MRSRRGAHAVVSVVAAVVRATVSAVPIAVPVTVSVVAPVAIGAPSIAPSVAAAQPAQDRDSRTSTPASSELPSYRPPPERFAVVPFENRSGVRVFDWLVAAAPFEIASKTEVVLELEPTGGPLFLGATVVPPVPTEIARFAAERGATWVVTGWVERPNWELKLSLTLWKVEGGSARVVDEATRQGALGHYHRLLGEALGEVWSAAGKPVDAPRNQRLQRPLAGDLYAVHLMGRGLGHLVGVLPPPTTTGDARAAQLAKAEHDLERSVFIDPKCHEAQRLVGELYTVLAEARGEPKLLTRASGKFSYAYDLAPTDPQALRAAAKAAARANKHENARELFSKLVMRRPWDLDARYELGAASWHTGQVDVAERQLREVTRHDPDHLPARRVLVLIHASRGDTPALATELEAIVARTPDDLAVRADLAAAYGALGRWERSTEQLEAIALARPPDVALLVRIGDGHRRQKQLDAALAWYGRAAKIAPDSSLPGFMAAQALLDEGRLADANRAYLALQTFKADAPAVEQALGVIALRQGKASEAVWYLRRAVRGAPRSLLTWRALVAALLAHKDATAALTELERARPTWPRDGHLLYLEAIANAMTGRRLEAREALIAALEVEPELSAARAALHVLDAGGSVSLAYTPDVVRPWGDAEAVTAALDRFATVATRMSAVRAAYQHQLLSLLAMLGRGPYAPAKTAHPRTCPVGRIAPAWAAAQQELRAYERLGVDLEAEYRYLVRHEEAGTTQGLLPDARARLSSAKRQYRTALADVTELRAEWSRGLEPELRAAGCSDRLLAAAVADPGRYRVIVDEPPPAVPERAPARPRPRATFYVDNTQCADSVDVWIDGAYLGQVAPGRRSALVADGGERTMCLLGPGSAQCGDRGTLRQVYLHDGWSVTLHCAR